MSGARVSEAERLAVLHGLGVLDAPAELHLDTLCRTAAAAFGTPVAFIALIDGTEVFVKSSHGVPTGMIPRCDAFCDQTIALDAGEALVIGDLLQDEIFRASPLVVGELHARFYAGVPICLGAGVNIGTFCLVDRKARGVFDAEQIERLKDLGRLVEEHFRLRAAERLADRLDIQHRVAASNEKLDRARREAAGEMAEAAAGFGRWHVDKARTEVVWSTGIARIFGRPMPADGRMPIADHIACYLESSRDHVARRIADAFAARDLEGDGGYRIRAQAVRPNGGVRDVIIQGVAAIDDAGEVSSLHGVLLDVTDLTASEREAEESRDLLRLTLESMDQGLLMLGPDSRVRIHNRRARSLLGLPETLLYDGAPFEPIRRFLVDRGEYADADSKSKAWAKTGAIERVTTHYERERPDGTALEIRAVPLADGGVVRTYTDVSRRRKIERAVQDSERRYRLLAENTTDVIIWAGLDTVRRYVSPASKAVLGYEASELVGTRPLDLTHPDDRDSLVTILDDLCRGRVDQATSSQRYRHKEGGWVWIETSFSLMRDGEGKASGYVASLRDISDRKAVDDALRDSEELLSLALDSGSDGIWDCNVVTGEVRLAGEWLAILGYAEGEIASHIGAWQALTHPDDALRLKDLLHRHFKGLTPAFECEYRILSKNGRYVWTLARGRVVARRYDGHALRMVGTHIDITKRKEIELQITHMALHDALTGLPNRILFRDRLEHVTSEAERTKRVFAVLACDLDRFKAVNDTMGHAAGDAILRIVADRLRSVVRDHDMVARLGGDEFALIVEGLDHISSATLVANQMIAAIAKPMDVEGRLVVIGVSIGIVVGPRHGQDAEHTFKNADIALYRAKADGRSTYRFFEPEMDSFIARRNTLENAMRDAVGGKAFVLHYQPVIDLATDAIGGFEALMRWFDADGMPISPEEFIPLAEDTGIIIPLGDWALREACREATFWPDHVRIAVNVSAVQFQHGGLEASVERALASSSLAAHRLELEITESVLINDADGVIACLHRLRAMGVRIALDDFGTGYSSLSYLRRFPFDKIKIDRAFIRDIDDPGTAAIVRAVVGLGARVGAAITAEGVETEVQLLRVRQEGCTEVQGFLYGQPATSEAARKLIVEMPWCRVETSTLLFA